VTPEVLEHYGLLYGAAFIFSFVVLQLDSHGHCKLFLYEKDLHEELS